MTTDLRNIADQTLAASRVVVNLYSNVDDLSAKQCLLTILGHHCRVVDIVRQAAEADLRAKMTPAGQQ